MTDKNRWYRKIPNINLILENEQLQDFIQQYGRESVLLAVRRELQKLRQAIGTCESEAQADAYIDAIYQNICKCNFEMHTPDMCRVINATGTILHTNLGRAPLSLKHLKNILQIVSGYSNLEYNLEEGRRGERYSHFERLLCEITGAEAAMAVNNNASSVLLILSALSKGKEAVTSRGELIEIGGKFRIPDVMEQSGAILKEVGTTNKTHLSDYENAICENTGVLLKVHTSNYRILGFTESVSTEALAELANRYELPLIEDLGSGVLIDLEKYGLPHEPMVQEALKKGVDVVCFSGDKLLGGPQAGIIVGKKTYIEQLKRHPLTRALRIDKCTAALLEQVLMEYYSEETAVKNLPVLRMIARKEPELTAEAQILCKKLSEAELPAEFQVEACMSQIGGGSMPLSELPGSAVTIKPWNISVNELEQRMRRLPIPVIVRIADDKVILNVRTMEAKDYEPMVQAFQAHRIFE